jgi:RNA polymerase sigma-70 factor (ECF subfamily)
MIVMTLPDVTDDDILLKQARRGNKRAISDIYERYVEAIYQFVRLRVGHIQQAEDITSAVFTAFIEQITTGRGPSSHLRGWLFQVARNHIYDSYGEKRGLPLETIEQMSAPHTTNPEHRTLQSISREQVQQLIQQLTPDQQDVLLLRFDQQLSLKEVSDILGKNTNTVKSLQLRAVRALQRAIARQGVDVR